MRQFSSRKPILIAAAACIASIAMSTSTAQGLFTSEREILRQSRLQWLTMKRDMPQPGNPRIQPFVEDWEVVVFDNEAANAFAMPGGKIGVFTGIFEVADNPDALAAVIGHEIAHLTEDHVMRRARRGTLTSIASIMGGAAIGMRRSAQGAAEVALSLPFDRGQESEADIVGLDYMARAGFDPRSSIYLWKNMAELNADRRMPEFLSTHPSGDRRMGDLIGAMTPALITSAEAKEQGRYANCIP